MVRRVGIAWILFTGLALIHAARAGAAGDAAAVEFFEAKVRPVLAARCLGCHGPAKQRGGLRLDSRAAVLNGGESGPAAVPGKPAESLIVDAVNYGETFQMPPKSRLPADEVAALTRWVSLGLPWPDEGGKAGASGESKVAAFDLKVRAASHWAWKPVRPQTPPDVKDADWPAGPIDRFILAGLESRGMTPAPEADRRTLLRRLTFDLVGLPPTPEEADAFLNDDRPDAWERLVDRLLASPRFGERWGRHWLDLVRYAESRGHEFDATIPNAWRYRDYVVRALNADVPYDQFLTEHLAGDLLEQPRIDPSTQTNESLLGTGFWFLGEEVHSPVDLRADEADRVDNRLDVMSKTFLGLTVACARCHDHKFDAISQRDYYALGGFLLGPSYRQARFATAAAEERAARDLQALEDSARPRILALAARAARPGIERLAATLSEARDGGSSPSWRVELNEARGDRTHPLHDFASRTVPAAAPLPTPARVIVDYAHVAPREFLQDGVSFGLRPARPGDLRFPGDGGRVRLLTAPAARIPDGWVLGDGPDAVRDHGKLGQWDRSGQTLRTPEFTLRSGKLWYLVEGSGRAFASINSHTLVAGPLHDAVFREWSGRGGGFQWVAHDLSAYQGYRLHLEFSPDGAPLAVRSVVEADREPPLPGLACKARTPGDIGGPPSADDVQRRFEDAARRMEADQVDEGYAAEADRLLAKLDLFTDLRSQPARAFSQEVARVANERSLILRSVPKAAPSAPAMLDGNGVDGRLLVRGSAKTPGPEVPRRFLEAIAGDAPIAVPGGGSGRLELARAMLAPSNPFTRRVLVNRVWHHLFGRGIVASVDNLGVLGELPTHPELLDHLADSFDNDGWSVKRLIRSIVTTKTYRLSSTPDPGADSADPENRWMRRRTVRRLQSEPLRDAILSVSGRLDGRLGGPSVPVHLTEFLQGRGRPASGPVDGGGRRSLYLATRRNFLSPMMLTFDAPIPFTTIGRRNVSNVPAQALTLMNDPFVIEQARLWASRTNGRAPGERVAMMYRAAFARPPSASEAADALEFVAEQSQELHAGAGDPRPWADLAHVLINAKEFAFLD